MKHFDLDVQRLLLDANKCSPMACTVFIMADIDPHRINVRYEFWNHDKQEYYRWKFVIYDDWTEEQYKRQLEAVTQLLDQDLREYFKSDI